MKNNPRVYYTILRLIDTVDLLCTVNKIDYAENIFSEKQYAKEFANRKYTDGNYLIIPMYLRFE